MSQDCYHSVLPLINQHTALGVFLSSEGHPFRLVLPIYPFTITHLL